MSTTTTQDYDHGLFSTLDFDGYGTGSAGGDAGAIHAMLRVGEACAFDGGVWLDDRAADIVAEVMRDAYSADDMIRDEYEAANRASIERDKIEADYDAETKRCERLVKILDWLASEPIEPEHADRNAEVLKAWRDGDDATIDGIL